MATKIKYCTALYFPLKERYISMSAQVGFGYLPRVQSSLCVLMCDRMSAACVSGRSRASDVVTLCLTPPVNSPRVHRGSSRPGYSLSCVPGMCVTSQRRTFYRIQASTSNNMSISFYRSGYEMRL